VSDFKLPDPTLPEPGDETAEPDASSEETVPNEQRA
jgi:twitching motility protein PilJ